MAYDDVDQRDERPLPAAKALTDADLSSLVDQFPWTAPQISRIYRDMGGWCGSDDLAKFLYICNKRNLDPLLGEVHAEFRWNRRAQSYTMAPIVHIEGIRKLADLTSLYDGQDAPVYEVGPKGELLSATVRVYRKGCAHPFEATCYLAEYGYGPMWKKMPHVMLAKVAEAAAFRKAFPAALAGVYIPEEFQQDTAEVEAPQPAPEFPVGRKAPEQPQPPPVQQVVVTPQSTNGSAPTEGKPFVVPEKKDQTLTGTDREKTMRWIKELRDKIATAQPAIQPALLMNVINEFVRGYLAVDELPDDVESWQAPLHALEAAIGIGVTGPLVQNPTAAGGLFRVQLQKAFDTWNWQPIARQAALAYIRSKKMAYTDFAEWVEITGAHKLDTNDLLSFLALAGATNKAYRVLQMDRGGRSVEEVVSMLFKRFGGHEQLREASAEAVLEALDQVAKLAPLPVEDEPLLKG